MQKQSQHYDNSIENCLIKHCDNAETGTILIATNTNKSCQITLANGKIVAASMARHKGDDVAKELLKEGIHRASFTKNMKFPHALEAQIYSTQKFLNALKDETPYLTLVPDASIKNGTA